MKDLISNLEKLNKRIKNLNKSDLKIWDEENPEYYITEINYDPAEDKIYCKFAEDEKESKKIHKSIF